MNLIYNMAFWRFLGIFCILEGIVLFLGKWKSLSFFAFTKYKDKAPAELYKLEGIGDILFGIMLFAAGYIVTHVSVGAGMALIIASFVLYVIFLVYLYSKIKKQ